MIAFAGLATVQPFGVAQGRDSAGGERRGRPGRCLWERCRPVAKEGRGSTGKNLNPVIRIRLSNFCGENASGCDRERKFVYDRE